MNKTITMYNQYIVSFVSLIKSKTIIDGVKSKNILKNKLYFTRMKFLWTNNDMALLITKK